MLSSLPIDRILTETDAPYMGPVRGERNEPANVVGTVAFLAELRGWTPDEAKNRIWKNYCTLFEA
jgi:TatD DNase family protein